MKCEFNNSDGMIIKYKTAIGTLVINNFPYCVHALNEDGHLLMNRLVYRAKLIANGGDKVTIGYVQHPYFPSAVLKKMTDIGSIFINPDKVKLYAHSGGYPM